MPLQSSGAISLNNIQTEFGGSNPIGINEYYGSGGAPASGTISIGDFYGRSAFTFTNNMFGSSDDLHCNQTSVTSYFGNVIYNPPSRQVYIDMGSYSANSLFLYKDSSITQSWYANGNVADNTFTDTIFGNEDYYQFGSDLARGSGSFQSNAIFLNNSSGLRIFKHTAYNYCGT